MSRHPTLTLWRLRRNPPGVAHIEKYRDDTGVWTWCHRWLPMADKPQTATAPEDRIRHGARVCQICLGRLPAPTADTDDNRTETTDTTAEKGTK